MLGTARSVGREAGVAMESVVDALEDIGYDGPLKKQEALSKAIEEGPKSVEFTNLVHEISEELKYLYCLEESVSATVGADDVSAFLLELSSFLKELGCPYICLITGHLSSRLQSTKDRLLLFDYLLSELMAARISVVKRPQESNVGMEVTIHETPTAKDLKDILIALKFNKPPPDVTAEVLFSKIEAKIKENIQKEGPNYVGRPLYNKALTEKQWRESEATYKRLCDEYKMRREMLITRLDCTIQSFEWSGQGGKKREEIQSIYRPLRTALKNTTSIKMSDFLAARNTLLTLRKTSDAAVRINTKSQINKVIIGKVPDRGGRPSEQEPPPPEMPSWQQQRSQGGGGGRGGGSGFGGGGKVQGNWNQGDNRGNSAGRGGRNQNSQDNRNNQSFQDRTQNFQDQNYEKRNSGNFQNYQQRNQNFQNQGYEQGYGYQNQSQNYQNQGYQNQGYQNQGYQNQGYQNQGYQGQSQGRNRYQNEHDDRTNNYDNRGGYAPRGRSNYNRGGRY